MRQYRSVAVPGYPAQSRHPLRVIPDRTPRAVYWVQHVVHIPGYGPAEYRWERAEAQHPDDLRAPGVNLVLTDAEYRRAWLTSVRMAEASLRDVPTWELLAEAEYRSREAAAVRAGVNECPDDAARARWELQRAYAGMHLTAVLEEIYRRDALAQGVPLRAPRRSTADIARELKGRLRLSEFLADRFTVPLRYAGGDRYAARCPWHDDGSPSLSVWDGDAPHFYCFGCGVHGDVYDWLDLAGMRFGEAVAVVAQYLGVRLEAAA